MSESGLRQLQELEEEYAECDRCPQLCASRRQIVFGGVCSSAPIMVIGEAPGAEEDAHGEAFIGDSGQLLMDLIAKAWPVKDDELEEIKNIQEDRDYFRELRKYLDEFVFWANLVNCRPEENRTPSAAEIKNCADRLRRTIYAVDPALIICAGKPATSSLVGKAVQITEKHGTIFDVSIPSPFTGAPVRYPMLAILHPSYLLRQGDQRLVKRKQGPTFETLRDLKEGLLLVESLYQTAYGRSFLEKT